MKALLLERLPHRFAAARATAFLAGPGRGIGVGPLRFADIEPQSLPNPNWHRVRPLLSGICGSDLATLDATSSRYFEQIVSFPFVPGHEVVGIIDGGALNGRRVVVEPVLGCEAREIEPRCDQCAGGHKGSCERIAFGHLRPGLQTGFCHDTGGGWSDSLVVHSSQIHEVPAGLSDEDAVMVEPSACAIHAVLRAGIAPNEQVVVLGSGTLGLCVVAAIRAFAPPNKIVAAAKHPHQAKMATALGADLVVRPNELGRAVRRSTQSLALSPNGPLLTTNTSPRSTKSNGQVGRLTGGTDVVIDCVGSAASIEQALSILRPGGRIIMVGMPGSVRVDLAPLWQREISMIGAYAYGMEDLPKGKHTTFDLAFDLSKSAGLGRLVSARYPLGRYEEAIRHAAAAGSRGSVKIVFDFRNDSHGDPQEIEARRLSKAPSGKQESAFDPSHTLPGDNA